MIAMKTEKRCDGCIQIQFIDNNDIKSACFGCVHRKEKVIKDYCEIDSHDIGFLDLWDQTCEYHETEME